MTKIAKCYGKIFVFSDILCFRQMLTYIIVQNYNTNNKKQIKSSEIIFYDNYNYF